MGWRPLGGHTRPEAMTAGPDGAGTFDPDLPTREGNERNDAGTETNSASTRTGQVPGGR